MNLKLNYLALIEILMIISALISTGVSSDGDNKKPTILIASLIRNKGHTLPYFLTLIERLEYPKDRISLWIRSDNNVDNTIEILESWLDLEKDKYHSVNVTLDKSSKKIEGERGIADWTPARFNHVIHLREEALNHGRKIWADFIFMIDADAFITNPNTLEYLISKDKIALAPLLKSDGMYSNFWAGMTEDYYYMRTDKYKPILNGEEIGCFDVPMIHTAVLINLKKIQSNLLTYKADKLKEYSYNGPKDDIITFAVGANISGISLHVCNEQAYGFVMVPLESQDTFSSDKQQLTNLKLEILARQEPLPLSKMLSKFVSYEEKDTLGMDKIYMINLLRRPERRQRMNECFNELGILAETVDAVDGRQWFRGEHINPLFLTFDDWSWELPFLREPDPLFKFYLGCAAMVLACMGCMTILPSLQIPALVSLIIIFVFYYFFVFFK